MSGFSHSMGLRRAARASLALLALGASASLARAEWPERPIRVSLGFPAGGGADILARWFTTKVADLSGATLIIENKPGMGGNLSVESVAKAKPDGYTILFGGAAGIAASPYTYKNLPFDASKDLVPVASVAELVFALTVAPNSPVKSVADLTAQLKAKGAKATYGWAVTSSLASSVLYLKDAGLPEVVQVTYKTTPAAVSDASAGQVDFAFADAMYALGQEKAGRVRILATTGSSRPAAAPDAPTMVEAGARSVVVAPWWAVFAPAGTPQPILAKLEAWFAEVSKTPATKEFLISQGADPLIGGPDFVRQRLAEDSARWKEVTSLAKLEPM
ncbi:MAG: hypothetical protein JWN93_1728 [Hyphomicrobiales bacterium]|nr:hypothetical protein [Hyphomicrobiales bacterium]